MSHSHRRMGLVAVALAVVGLFCWYSSSPAQNKEGKPSEWQIAAAFRSDDKLLLSINPAHWGAVKFNPVTVEAFEQGKSIAKVVRNLKEPSDPLTLDVPAAKRDQITLKIAAEGLQTAEMPLRDVLFVKGQETTLLAGQDYYAGSKASLQVTVQAIKSIVESKAVKGATVEVKLRDEKTNKTYDLATDKTNDKGAATVEFDVPEISAGQYVLEVTTKSTLGEEKLMHQVRIKTDSKILLVTDKPIYQPGQKMHLRALALQSFDMKPIANKDLLFEIEDNKGNKVFKKTFKTSDFGIASVDFQLADEVNMGDYHLRAVIGDVRAEKTVQVKRYQLPKFKTALTTDKTFYLPKETIKADLQSDYFFGKPVAKAKVEVTASTFDVAFKEFHKWTGKTDEQGHLTFQIQLPDYFVGQPLQKGNAICKLDVKLIDTADHREEIVKSLTVSDQPIKVSLLPQGGKLTPGLENRVFVAAIYPDGSPAPNCSMVVHVADQTIALPKTDESGLASFRFTPEQKHFRASGHGPRPVEFLGGVQQHFGPQHVLDLEVRAADARGNKATTKVQLNSHPFGENVLLRLNKAIYQAGDRMRIDVRSSAGLPTCYVDVVRGGQIMLSKWAEVKDGSAEVALDVPQNVFGSLEVHAYQMLQHGEIIRDSRVVYVQPRNDLKIDVQNLKAEFAPGDDARLRFVVTDSAGKPTAAALGVIVVDEAVYALQELQPGLEKVYFTLQEELMKPQVQFDFSPGKRIDNLVIQPQIQPAQQQIAEVLLTAVKLPAPARWNVDPGIGRKQQAESILSSVARAVFGYSFGHPALQAGKGGSMEFRPNLLAEMAKSGHLNEAGLRGPFGEVLTLGDLQRLDAGFTADRLAAAVTTQKAQQFTHQLTALARQKPAKYQKNGDWIVDQAFIDDAGKQMGVVATDGWGRAFRLTLNDQVKPNAKEGGFIYTVTSSGPDGKFGTKDDIGADAVKSIAQIGWLGEVWWVAEDQRANRMQARFGNDRRLFLKEARDRRMFRRGGEGDVMDMEAMPRNAPGGIGGMAPPMAAGAPQPKIMEMQRNEMRAMEPNKDAMKADRQMEARPGDAKAEGGGAAPITKVREYFPETMLWMPNLITDDKGIADLGVSFADSITTWRLSASANSAGGLLGNANVPLKVFQDFFVDIDLPIALTQTDEVAFPVAVYNYLKTPQTVKLQLQQEPWFTLLDDKGFERSLDLQPGEVTSVKYRIKANTIGHQPLLVKAFGTKKSDAVKRIVEVVPNGEKIERTWSDRLAAKATQTINIPEAASPDASKLLVRIYPGVMAQVMEGVDGILRLPGGCFEQTSSSAYPNILVVDYIKKAKVASPQMLMTAENYLNVGYQRLLTFERPGGGFDWWGSGEPLVWLSAYGLQEFNDMSKVYPIDRGIIDRTQAFLVRKMDKDGTWSNIGATHGETIERIGNVKLLLTSYVTWSLLESGYDKAKLQNSIAYVRGHLADAGDNAYILALAANALAAADPKDDSTLECVNRLEKLRHEIPDWKAVDYPCKTTSLTYARGDAVTVEATALAAMAMLKTGQHVNSANKALTYLVKVKGNGHWGSTQATILALRALVAGMGGPAVKDPMPFTITVNGKDVARGKVDADTSDVMQSFDLASHLKPGDNQVDIAIQGESGLMYQVLSRHYMPWNKDNQPVAKKKVVDVDVTYDRTKLSTNDLLHAKATLKYAGETPTFNVIVDLGIAPGFTVDAGEFAEMVAAKKIAKFSVTSRQVTLYIGDVKPGDTLTFDYSLKAKYPLRVQAPGAVAWEYYTPANRAESRPVEITVVEKK